MSQERIGDVLNSILEGQEKINEELAQISWIANSALQVSLTNQSMLLTLCTNNSPELEEIPLFQFLKKRVRDFIKLSFQLSFPINKNMSMDPIPKVVPCHIITVQSNHQLAIVDVEEIFQKYTTLNVALEKLQAKGLLKPLGPTPIPHPVPRRYNLNAHCRYHQGEGHTTDGCHILRHAIQDLIDQQIITPPSSTSNPNFV